MKNKAQLFTICAKALFLLAICFFYGYWLSSIEPVFSTELAMQQMQHDAVTSRAFSAYQYLKDIAGIIYIVMGLLLFLPELKRGVLFFIKRRNPKQSEESE